MKSRLYTWLIGVFLLSAVLAAPACSTSTEQISDAGQSDSTSNPIGLNDTDDTGSTQTAPTGNLAINEVVTQGGGDWVELIAVGDAPVQLSSYTLVDDNDDHTPAALPDVELASGEYYVLHAIAADESSELPFVPFKLGSNDSLTLALDGDTVDFVEWQNHAAVEGASYGRLPDGSGDFQLTQPTPGAKNEAWPDGEEPCVDPFVTDKVLTIEIELSAEAWAAIKADPSAKEYQQGNFIYEGKKVETVGVRTKGNSSLNSVAKNPSNRYPLKVDFNRFVDGQAFCGTKKLAFNNGFKDPSFLREHLAYKVAREIGLPASRTAFVDLTVAGEHLGLYTMIEVVDDDLFLEANFSNDDGDLYKPDWPDGHLKWKSDTYEDYDGFSIENNADTSDHSAFITLLDTINHGTPDDVEKILNVDGMLKYAAFNAVFVNLDSYTGNGHNYYLYEQERIFTIVPWDLNEAFGKFTCGCSSQEIIDFFIDEPTCGSLADRPLLDILLQKPEWLDQYHQHLKAIIEGSFAQENMEQWVLAGADLIRPYVYADPTKFFSDADFEDSLVTEGKATGNTMALLPFVADRINSIQQQLEDRLPATNNGEGNCGQGGVPGGGGPGGGGNPKCPDGICDAFEQAHPEVCPEDCE